MNREVQKERWRRKQINVYLDSTRRKMDHQTEKHLSRDREFQEGLEGDCILGNFTSEVIVEL